MSHIGTEVTLDDIVYIHETAHLYGKIYIGPRASIWPNVVMRAEMHEIKIGARTNIQDFVMVHVGSSTPTIVGDDCSITHHVTLHGCDIGDRCLIGINATVMDGAKIGSNSIVAGHSIVSENKSFPENSVIAGVPAKVICQRDNSEGTLFNASFYETIARNYAKGIERLSPEQLEDLQKVSPSAQSGI